MGIGYTIPEYFEICETLAKDPLFKGLKTATFNLNDDSHCCAE
jgi:hypothetical protein